MDAGADLQVWLETFYSKTQPAFIVPYVRSKEDTHLTYRLNTVKVGRSGRSELKQSGSVEVQAEVPVAIVRMSVTRDAGDECQIDLYLQEARTGEREYHFECPSTK